MPKLPHAPAAPTAFPCSTNELYFPHAPPRAPCERPNSHGASMRPQGAKKPPSAHVARPPDGPPPECRRRLSARCCDGSGGRTCSRPSRAGDAARRSAGRKDMPLALVPAIAGTVPGQWEWCCLSEARLVSAIAGTASRPWERCRRWPARHRRACGRGVRAGLPMWCRAAASGLRWRFCIFLPPAVQGGSGKNHLAYAAYFGPSLYRSNLHRSILGRFRQHVQTVGFLYPGKLAIGAQFARGW